MVWRERLGGAFLTGEGQHGFVHPVTRHYIDDAWFYGLNAHAWRCVKPGSHVDTIQLQLNKGRFETDARGKLVPVAQLGHGYELVSYVGHGEDPRAPLLSRRPPRSIGRVGPKGAT